MVYGRNGGRKKKKKLQVNRGGKYSALKDRKGDFRNPGHGARKSIKKRKKNEPPGLKEKTGREVRKDKAYREKTEGGFDVGKIARGAVVKWLRAPPSATTKKKRRGDGAHWGKHGKILQEQSQGCLAKGDLEL